MTVTGIGEMFDQWWSLLAQWHSTEQVDDLEMYRRLQIRYGSPAVELGVGDGRVAAHVRPEFGVDLSSVMLHHCRERLGSTIQLLQADFEAYRLPEPAKFSYMPLNTVNHIPAGRREAVFRHIRDQTDVGGTFAFDSRIVSAERLRAANRVPMLMSRDEHQVIYQTSTVLDWRTDETRLDTCIETLDSAGHITGKRFLPAMPFWHISPGQVRQLAHTTGWTIEAGHGDFNFGPLTGDSKLQVWVLKRQ